MCRFFHCLAGKTCAPDRQEYEWRGDAQPRQALANSPGRRCRAAPGVAYGPRACKLRAKGRLAPVLNSPVVPDGATVTSSAEAVPIDTMVKRHDGATYLFAVGMRNAAAKGTFAVHGLKNATAEILGEGRKIPVRDGKFTDDFQAYDAHLYRIR